MRLTALPPPPPTPITLIRAPRCFFIVKLNAHLCGFDLLLIHSGWRLPIRR